MVGVIRHRRLTIAALALVVLGGGLWWLTRPKIDPRFVGTWDYFETQDGQDVRSGRIAFHKNGSLDANIDAGSSFRPVSWQVSGDELRLYRPFAGWLSFRIVSITAHEIRFERGGIFGLTLKRMPE